MKSLALPTAASVAPAVAGATFWNAYDSVNMNYFTYGTKKQLKVVNTNATGSVTLTVKTKDDTVAGLDRVVEDLVITLGPEEVWESGILPSVFNDANKVKIELADVAAGDSLADCFIAVVNVT
jgi:hypothetical protein